MLGWFKEWIGYPPTASGILVSGGSAANMTALACARESLVGPMSDDLVAYVPDQAHSSVARAARVLGFRPSQVRVLPVGEGFRLDPATLRGAIESDRGRRPPAAVRLASAAAARAPARSIRCRRSPRSAASVGAWLHVDAAYGGFAALTERGREALAGIELADSVTIDPHKWLYQPYECGCLLVRDGSLLRRAFEIAPDYLLDAVPDEGEVNFSDLGMQLSRTSHALKVWTSRCGRSGSRRFATRSTGRSTRRFSRERLIDESDTLEIVSPAQLGVVCFRRRFADAADEYESDAMHEQLIAALERSGIAFISSTRLRGRFAMRMCVMNFTTRDEDIAATIAFLASEPVAARSDPAHGGARSAISPRSWLARPARRHPAGPDRTCRCSPGSTRIRHDGSSPSPASARSARGSR